jgi:hypothetical protein
MARPHIEFIQAQALDWRTLGPEASRPGADAKPLSYDPETQAVSVILRYLPGWSLPQAHYLDCDEELFVLAGALVINDEEYGVGDYAYLPAGFPRAGMFSPKGADVLTFYEGPHRNVPGMPPPNLFDAHRLIRRKSTRKMPWEGPRDPIVAATAAAPRRRSLRDDPETGDQTWILAMNADDPAIMTQQRTETHPVVEESFVLEGEITMHCGVMHAGAYFWRPPNIEHGPVGTRTGFTAFFRTKGGKLSTRWSEESRRIVWDAPYRPSMPDNVRTLVKSEYDRDAPY